MGDKVMSEQEIIAMLMKALNWPRQRAIEYMEAQIRAGNVTPVDNFEEEDRANFKLWSGMN